MKKRLDLLLVEKKWADTPSRARSLIMSGNVLVDRHPADKAGLLIGEAAVITVKDRAHPYVSRGGVKLAGAIKDFNLKIAGLTCLDVGASTGGFTDCLLQSGAKQVFAVDVGYGQMAWQLRTDPRVVVIERTNIRHMQTDIIKERIDLATIDVSFISLKKVVPRVLSCLNDPATIVALIKPQFEVRQGCVGKGGVVRDPAQHQEVILDLTDFFQAQGLTNSAVVPSSLLGPKGNKEFFIHLKFHQEGG